MARVAGNILANIRTSVLLEVGDRTLLDRHDRTWAHTSLHRGFGTGPRTVPIDGPWVDSSITSAIPPRTRGHAERVARCAALPGRPKQMPLALHGGSWSPLLVRAGMCAMSGLAANGPYRGAKQRHGRVDQEQLELLELCLGGRAGGE